MSFKNKKYLVIKNAISKELATFNYNYLLMKQQVHKTLTETNYLPINDSTFGTYTDDQVRGTYSNYGDIAMDTLLLLVKPLMEEKTKIKLLETYSYARIYKSGDELKRHKDRPSCAISCTMNLGGDSWPIFIEPSGKENKKGKKVILGPGDLLIYRGCDLEHWREHFTGDNCAQVFLHYNDSKEQKNIFDNRPHLGLPSYYKKNV